LVQSDFKNSPRVYVTTVGLYNAENELLAVAKLSKPVRKSFDEEILLRVRLDYWWVTIWSFNIGVPLFIDITITGGFSIVILSGL
jgi:hypothetical protein